MHELDVYNDLTAYNDLNDYDDLNDPKDLKDAKDLKFLPVQLFNFLTSPFEAQGIVQ